MLKIIIRDNESSRWNRTQKNKKQTNKQTKEQRQKSKWGQEPR